MLNKVAKMIDMKEKIEDIKANLFRVIPFFEFKPYISNISESSKIIHIRKGVKIFVYKDHIEISGNGFKCYENAEFLRIDDLGNDICKVTNGNWEVLFPSSLIPMIKEETGITQ